MKRQVMFPWELEIAHLRNLIVLLNCGNRQSEKKNLPFNSLLPYYVTF